MNRPRFLSGDGIPAAVLLGALFLALPPALPALVRGSDPGPGSRKSETNLFLLRGAPFPEGTTVQVVPLSRTDAVSVQLVRIRDEVKPHLHRIHTETIAILWGEGTFRIGGREHGAVPGDVFVIPPGVVHAFRVRGDEPVGAVTTFSPGFDGKDRVYVEEP